MDRVWKSENQVLVNGSKTSIDEFDMEDFLSKLSSRDQVADQIYKIRSKDGILK
jgi:hypothetical protein